MSELPSETNETSRLVQPGLAGSAANESNVDHSYLVENLTYGLRANAHDLHDIWRKAPDRRDEFGATEIAEIEEAKKKLAELEQFILIHQNRKMRGVA